jgi:hypothetical protein
MKRKLHIKITYLILIVLVVSSCSLPRTVEKSEKERPDWVYGISKGYMIVEGVGYTWEDAQDNALKKLKERIVNSIAVNVNSEMNVEISETVIDNMSRYNENVDVKTNISTDFLNSLKGISLNKSKAFYWEKQKHPDKTKKIHYHIMYPFSERELNELIMEWEKMDKGFTEELDNLEQNLDNCNSVSEMNLLYQKAESLEEIFTNARKTRASLIKSEITQLLENLKFEVQTHERGRLVLKLLSSDRYFRMDPQLDFNSRCAVLQDHKLIDNNEALEINYDADFCFSEENAGFEIRQNYNGTNLSYDFLIPDGEKSVRFTINEPARFKKSSVNPNNIRWFIPLRIFTETPFTVTKVELVVSHESKINLRSLIGGDEKESYFIADVTQEFNTKGDFSLQFEVAVDQNSQSTFLGHLINIFMEESSTFFAGGKIHIKPDGEDKEYVFVFQNKRIARSK